LTQLPLSTIYIEAHPQFGPLVKEVVNAFQSKNLSAYSSVITLAEVLPKPTKSGDERLTRKFAEFLKHGRNLIMIEISERIAVAAGKLRGRYPFLKTVDAIQLAAALDLGAEAFLTNDERLGKFKELKVLVLKDYI
jgi:predicted nucleic acid-binding protein